MTTRENLKFHLISLQILELLQKTTCPDIYNHPSTIYLNDKEAITDNIITKDFIYKPSGQRLLPHPPPLNPPHPEHEVVGLPAALRPYPNVNGLTSLSFVTAFSHPRHIATT